MQNQARHCDAEPGDPSRLSGNPKPINRVQNTVTPKEQGSEWAVNFFFPSVPSISNKESVRGRSQELVPGQGLVFVKRDEKGQAAIKRHDLGSEFTAGSQELDTINLAAHGCGGR